MTPPVVPWVGAPIEEDDDPLYADSQEFEDEDDLWGEWPTAVKW